jgi:hypothetical protein
MPFDMKIAHACSALMMLMALASGVKAGDNRSSAAQDETSKLSRLPVVRAPTQGKAVTTTLPMQPRAGSEAELYFAPLPESSPAKTRKKTGKSQCISTNSIRSTDVRDDRTIRLTLGMNKQVDMKLYNRCPGLAFDESFYYQPGPTMELCARQDTIMARSGSRCLIDAFVPVVPTPKK